MNKIICDKCGKEITGKKYIVSIKQTNKLFFPQNKEIDLCDKCVEEVLKYNKEEWKISE